MPALSPITNSCRRIKHQKIYSKVYYKRPKKQKKNKRGCCRRGNLPVTAAYIKINNNHFRTYISDANVCTYTYQQTNICPFKWTCTTFNFQCKAETSAATQACHAGFISAASSTSGYLH